MESFANEVKISTAGLRKGIDSCKLGMDYIIKICDLLSISPNEFFGYSPNGIASCRVCEEKDKRIAVMEKYIKSLEEQIALLKGSETTKEKRKAV